MDVVKQLFRAGYGTKEIAYLRDGLKTMGIKGDPHKSMKRFVQGLERVKSLDTLRKQTKEAEGELKATRRDLSAAKAELKSMRDTTLKALNEARDEVTAEMRGVMAELKEDVKGWGKIQRETGKLQRDIISAQNFMAFMREDEVLEKVPLSFTTALMGRISLWITKRHSQVRVAPSKEVQGKDNSLSTWHKYSLAALAEFVDEALDGLRKS